MSNPDIVLRAIKSRVDDRGYMRTTLDQLVMDTGLGRNTVKRHLDRLGADGTIQKKSKAGPGGGLIIRLKSGPESGPQSGPKSAQNPASRNDSTHSPGPSALGGVLRGPNSKPAQGHDPDAGIKWFVCCIWRDEHNNEWCHGDDGVPTYIPCESKEEAKYVADQHRFQPHKDREASLPSRPCVDIVRTVPGSKVRVLAERLGVLDDGRPGGIDNPWARGQIDL